LFISLYGYRRRDQGRGGEGMTHVTGVYSLVKGTKPSIFSLKMDAIYNKILQKLKEDPLRTGFDTDPGE